MTDYGWSSSPFFERLSRVAAVAILMGLSLLAPSAASAQSPFDWGYAGGGDEVRAPDSRGHSYCLTHHPGLQTWISSAMQSLNAATVMYDQRQASCDAATDVVWVRAERNSIDAGASSGQTICVRHVSWGVCDQFWVRIDTDQVLAYSATGYPSNPSAYFSLNAQHLMRHELGHTAGLHHYLGPLRAGYGAMNGGHPTPDTPGYLYYLTLRPFQINLIDSNP